MKSTAPTMRLVCLKIGQPAPIFTCVHGEFKVIMRNGYNIQSDFLSDSILGFCDIPRSRKELVEFSGKTKNYIMTQVVLPLVDSGKLKLTIPEKPQSPNQKYVKAE